MIDYGLRRRHGRTGLWLYTHDAGGADWGLLLPLGRELGLYLHDHGYLCIEGDAVAGSLHPGIISVRDGLEARLALCHPETRVAFQTLQRLDLSQQTTPVPLASLWSSERPR